MAPCVGRNFWQIEGGEALCFTAFFADIALVTCFVSEQARLPELIVSHNLELSLREGENE